MRKKLRVTLSSITAICHVPGSMLCIIYKNDRLRLSSLCFWFVLDLCYIVPFVLLYAVVHLI